MFGSQNIKYEQIDFDIYQESTDAMVKKFMNGDLYEEDPNNHFVFTSKICDHFAKGISNVNRITNETITRSHEEFGETARYGEALDFVEEAFEFLEDYIEFICNDFNNFKGVVLSITDKEGLESRCRIKFNLVDNLICDIGRNIERVHADLCADFFSKLTDAEKEARVA